MTTVSDKVPIPYRSDVGKHFIQWSLSLSILDSTYQGI
jgi:hypothetical protein